MAWRVEGNSPLLYTATGATTRESRMSAFLLDTTSTATVVIEENTGWLSVPRLRMYGFGADRLAWSAGVFEPAPPEKPLSGIEKPQVTASWACGPDLSTVAACAAVPATLGFTCPENRFGYIDSGVPAAEGQDCTAPYTSYDPTFSLVVDELPQVGGDDAAPIFAACGSVGVCGSTPLKSTCIPTMLLNNQDSDPTWIIENFEYHEDPVAPGSLFGVLTATTARVNVMYKDVDVLQLPDGSWFMVMVRLRWRAPPETELTPPDSCPPGPGAAAVPPFSEQLCDIVGWWSPDASFATGQERGPFLVVDSLDALPSLDARFWLGVPGAVIATSEGRQSLYVYYMVEPQYSLVEPPVESGPDVGPEIHPDLGPGFGPDLDPDLSRFSIENAYRQVIKQWENSSWAREPFVAGPAVKRIDLDDLYEAIGIGAAGPAASTDQPTWTMADAIPGGLLGQIRVWLTHPELTGPRPAVRSWRDGYPVELPAWKSGAGPWVGVGLPWLAAAARVGPGSGLYFSLAPKIADPAPVAVPDAFPPFLPWVAMQPTALKLYFAAIAPDDPGVVMTPTHGYGVWCASGIPAPADGGTLLQVVVGEVGLLDPVEPIFGIDFLICTAVDGRGLPRDMIAGDSADPRGGGHYFVYLDPDPIKDPADGSWRVHAGMTGGGLTLILGDAEDGDRSWEEGWCHSPPELEPIDLGSLLAPPAPVPDAQEACAGRCDGAGQADPPPEAQVPTPAHPPCACA